MSNANQNGEEAKDQGESAPIQLPQSVIDYYAKYKNVKDDVKTCIIMGTRFELEDRYEIIDSGTCFYNLP